MIYEIFKLLPLDPESTILNSLLKDGSPSNAILPVFSLALFKIELTSTSKLSNMPLPGRVLSLPL
jgi:hypothetical protein